MTFVGITGPMHGIYFVMEAKIQHMYSSEMYKWKWEISE